MIKKLKKADPFFARELLKYKHPIPSREFITEYFSKVAEPLRYQQLLKIFAMNGKKNSDALRKRLRAMVRDGQLLQDRRGRFVLVKKLAALSGYVISHRDGYGFLVPDEGGDDIFLNPREMRKLFPGDRVLVSVTSSGSSDRKEGVVIDILKRDLTHVVGRYDVIKGASFITPTNKNIVQDIIIPPGKNAGAKTGQFVVAKIINYPTQAHGATAEIIKILGATLNAKLALEIAINSYGLPHVWHNNVLSASEALANSANERKKNSRQELGHLPFVTIDGEDAKDFDDAVYCSRHKNGWTLYVAIADVSHYVKFGSDLDKEALNRGNSVYFPGQVVPMLPEVLSNDLCSLKPEVRRLTVVCEMEVSCDGKIAKYKFYDAVIKSHARLTYDEVFALLEGKSNSREDLLPHLQELKDLYNVLLKQRKIRGALDFNRVEAKIIFDAKGKAQDIRPIEHHYVHSLIEECMLAANVCASKFLLHHKIPALYRIHEGPDQDKLYNLRMFLKNLGLELKGANQTRSLDYAQLLTKIRGRRDEHLIETVLLRSMRQAVYTAENVGHFGLAYESYLHFTSPIRRYPDLVNHRAIKYLLSGGKVGEYCYTKNEMQNLGSHCSLTERRADDATRDVVAWYKCEFMRDKVGKAFSGIISGVTNFGIFVELKDIFIEGLVHITALPSDYYQFDQIHQKLSGRRGGKVYRLGDPIKVVVAKVNPSEREMDFALV